MEAKKIKGELRIKDKLEEDQKIFFDIITSKKFQERFKDVVKVWAGAGLKLNFLVWRKKMRIRKINNEYWIRANDMLATIKYLREANDLWELPAYELFDMLEDEINSSIKKRDEKWKRRKSMMNIG